MSFERHLQRRKTGTYAVTRRSASSFTKGRQVAGGTTALDVEGILVPVAGEELLRLPEGERNVERATLYTAVLLRTAGASGEADVVSASGKLWEVETVKDYREFGGPVRSTLRRATP